MKTRKLIRYTGWLLLVVALILAVPVVLHVLHLGLLMIKLAAEVAVVLALAFAGVWLVKHGRAKTDA